MNAQYGNKHSVTFLGIDPGFSVTGYSILKKEGGKTFLLDLGYLQLSPKNELSVRVGTFYDFFIEKVKKFEVKELALETSFLGKNAQTFLKLGFLRGVLYLIANQHNLRIFEFSPREVKLSITGFGGASKEQVATALTRIFPALSNLNKTVKEDVTDSLAICLCGLWQSEQRIFNKI